MNASEASKTGAATTTVHVETIDVLPVTAVVNVYTYVPAVAVAALGVTDQLVRPDPRYG
jgi:hypothetical protein